MREAIDENVNLIGNVLEIMEIQVMLESLGSLWANFQGTLWTYQLHHEFRAKCFRTDLHDHLLLSDLHQAPDVHSFLSCMHTFEVKVDFLEGL